MFKTLKSVALGYMIFIAANRIYHNISEENVNKVKIWLANSQFKDVFKTEFKVIFHTKERAEASLAQFKAMLNENGSATVADLYNIIGTSSTDMEKQYGWTDIGYTAIRDISEDTYWLVLPMPTPIDSNVKA